MFTMDWNQCSGWAGIRIQPRAHPPGHQFHQRRQNDGHDGHPHNPARKPKFPACFGRYRICYRCVYERSGSHCSPAGRGPFRRVGRRLPGDPRAGRRKRLLGSRGVLLGPHLQPPHPPRLRPHHPPVPGTLTYTGARVGAIARLAPRDLRDHGEHRTLRFQEKGGKEREIPVRDDLDQWLQEYIAAAGIADDPKDSPLFAPPGSAAAPSRTAASPPRRSVSCSSR